MAKVHMKKEITEFSIPFSTNQEKCLEQLTFHREEK